MGCHTWFYKKDNRTQQEAEAVAVRTFEGYVNTLPNNKVLRRQLDWIRKGKCPVAIWKYQGDDTFYVPDKGLYSGVNEYFDVFRVYAPDTFLFSLEETLKFLKLKKVKSDKKQLKEFWKKYPDGMIFLG